MKHRVITTSREFGSGASPITAEMGLRAEL